MPAARIKLYTKVLVIISLFLLRTGDSLSQTIPNKYLSTAESEFGKPIKLGHPLYEVNKDYALEVEFGANDRVRLISVAPKNAWQQLVPQWSMEPEFLVNLPEDKYNNLLTKINHLTSLGSLVHKGNSGIITVNNSKYQRWDQYEHAFIRRTIHCCPSDNPDLLFSFTIFFDHLVRGKITQIRITESPNDSIAAKVKIGGDWYLINDKELGKVRKGKRGSFYVAGPVD